MKRGRPPKNLFSAVAPKSEKAKATSPKKPKAPHLHYFTEANKLRIEAEKLRYMAEHLENLANILESQSSR